MQYYCKMTEGDKLSEGIKEARKNIADRRNARVASATVMAMLADVQSQFDMSAFQPQPPLDNPIINSGFVGL